MMDKISINKLFNKGGKIEMNKSFFKCAAGIIIAGAMTFTNVCSGITATLSADAAETNYHFDFGGSGAASGYTSVSAADGYDSKKGYGFANLAGVKNVTASGSNALSDAVQFTDTSWSNTFNVDLQNGLYRVGVTLGNTNRTSVVAEDVLQIMNMTGDNAYDSILIPVTDGQLNIMVTNGKEGYPHTLSALDIEWVSADTQLPPTIWMCGDSTVCNYYPKETSIQAGWGQVLDKFIDTNKWQVRDMAASGQYAKGFIEAGQFAPIQKYGKNGDIYIISIGINDTNYSNADEYKQAVTDMVKQAKDKGMRVILVKQQGRASDVNRTPLLKGRWFGTQLDEIGAAENVQVIDLFTAWQNYTTSIGYDATLGLYCTDDDLHPNRAGAMKLAEFASELIDFDGGILESGAEIDESTDFMLKNSNSGLYLTLENDAADGTNAVQLPAQSIDSGRAIWRAKSAGDGYYYLYNASGSGEYLLDVAGNKAENGTNIGVWSDTNCDAQLFKFIPNDDGSFTIATKISKDKSAVEVISASNDSGANVQEWERNGYACQNWFIERAVKSVPETVVGDINGDGKINIFDVSLLKSMLASNEKIHSKHRIADVNADATVNVDDCSALNKYILKRHTLSEAANGRQIYYAVDQAYNSAIEENTNAGFASDSYINFDNKIGSFAEWRITVPEKGNYLCTFKIANGSANDRKMKIEVNNGKDYWLQPFLTTSAWTTWAERAIVLPLNAGKNIIRTTSATAEGGPNIDYMRVELTDEPIAEIYIPDIKPEEPENNNKTIYIAGDSTVQTYRASYAPQQGWGAFLGNYFDEKINIENHAIAGRSSKSFYDNGRLDTILNKISAGDYLLVQFGINDSAAGNAERYAPTCGNVPGTEGSYEFYMAKYIEGAKEKGAVPILITPTLSLKNNTNGKFNASYTNYTDSVKKLADYYKIPYIDLNGLMVDHYNSIGYDKAYTYHMCSTGSTDMTHFTETGANAVAGLLAGAIKKLNIDISDNVK